MAHIPDGVLSVPVLAAGGVLTAAGLAIALPRMSERTIPRAGIFAAGFFALSLIAVPLGPSSVHLLLGGLMGLVIGPLTIPAVLVALVLQALLFGFGGLTTLGINTLNIAVPGVLLALAFGPFVKRARPSTAGLLAAACAALSVAITGTTVAASLALSSSEFVPSAKVILATYGPLMAIEAVITGFAVSFLKRVRPELLASDRRAFVGAEP